MKIYSSTYSGGIVSKDAGKDQISKNGFLKLLAAELQNQDPMNSKDNTEYIAQMVQFTSLEQMQNLNSTMESLLLSQKFQEAGSMIGKIAKVMVGEGQYVEGKVKSAKLGSGTINIVIDGKEYDVDNVVELAAEGSDEVVV